MNRAYKLVWNTVSNSWIVASELAKGRKKSSAITVKSLALLLAGSALAPAYAQVGVILPGGESVTSGSATFDRSVSNQLTVNQSTSKLITNWNSFDVGTGGTVVFAQPDASSIALNRVTSGSATQIAGQVSANGQLVIVNPNGITFGAGSQVSASGIVASSLDILDSDFNAGNLLFSRGAATGSIDNKGSLTATAGSVSLLGATVKNSGTISASGGNAALINADAVNLTTANPSITTASSITGLIQQSGSITATQVSSVGGKILLTGDTSQAASQIQLAGTLDASTNTNVNGRSIVVNGDVNLNGASNALDLTSTAGYSLTNAAQLNLNGASSAFSVNGTAYTVIRDVNQLQNMNRNLSGKYVLASNIDASNTVTWNGGAGFAPVGDGSIFTGTLDGLGHAINALRINRPSAEYVGLIGYAVDSRVQNIGLLAGSVTGGTNSGGLIGYTNNSTVSNSYASGSVTGSGSGSVTGGLIGWSDNSTVSNSYASGSVTGGNYSGGLIGVNNSGSTVSNSYASGSVTGSYYSGGLIGGNAGTVSNSYASGSVTGGTYSGGLIGYNIAGTVSNNYWNTASSGKTVAVGYHDGGTLSNLVGLTDAQSKQLSSYANWGNSIDAQGGTGSVWRIYDGQSGPLLRSFLKPLNVANFSKTYDATAFAGSDSLPSGTDASKVLGTATLSGNALGAINAGTYIQMVSGLYSVQNGYDISSTGTVTINKRLLTISATDASKVYDGKLTSSGKPVVVGRQRGDAIVGLTQSYLDKNVGMGKAINVNAGFTIRDGNNGNNYDVVIVNSNAGEITPKDLIISAVSNTKVYDGGVTSANKPVVTGLVAGDRITGLFQQYDTKAVGIDKKIIVKPGFVISDGNGGFNYTLIEQSTRDGVITAN